MDTKTKKRLRKLKYDLYQETIMQKKQAWSTKDYKKSIDQRKKEKVTYEKWRLLNGLLKEMEKEDENN